MSEEEEEEEENRYMVSIELWRKCPPLVFITRVISILLYVNNVYLHSRAVRRGEERREERREERGEERGEERREERGEERGERGEERGMGPPSPRTRKLYKRVALAV